MPENATPQDLPASEVYSETAVLKVSSNQIIKMDEDGSLLNFYVRTTPGRIIFNKVIYETLHDFIEI